MANFLGPPEKTASSSSCGSSTGNTRNRVALLPGYSLMDWIKLGNSGRDLSGVNGAVLEVTEEELRDHASEDDAWICIRGKIYNITPYLGFHPGGIPELLKGIGKDATSLFMEIHPWVNYESILKKCFVGNLVRPKIGPSMTAIDGKPEMVPVTSETACYDESTFDSDIKMTWCQTHKTLKFVFCCKVPTPHVMVHLKAERHLRILIRLKKVLHVFSFRLEKSIIWPCFVSMNVDLGRLSVELEKKEEGLWKTYGENDPDHATIAPNTDEIDAYHSAEIMTIANLTHNVRIFVFKFLEKIVLWLPIGHDIRIRGIIDGIDCAKQYTPIPPQLPHAELILKHWHNHYLCVMIKYYTAGALTPFLFEKEEHDFVEIGGLAGKFNVRKLRHASDIYMIAAGSGLAPMLKLIVWGFSKKRQLTSMNLLYFNRTEGDIIWRRELNDLARKEKWFNVTYVLSNPGADWGGLKGRVSEKILQDFLPEEEVHPDQLPQFFICVCGPIQFTEYVEAYLIKRQFEKWSHCFY